jgi:DNA invertase Pin-like site-specific DNA recombinase
MTITTTATDLRPVASYARLSKRSGDGAGWTLANERQHEDNTATMAGAHPGAEIVYYGDNRSAWDESVTRPDFERLLADIASGQYRAVIAWHADRFTRQPIQLERLWSACKHTGTELWTGAQQVTDVTMLRIQSALAAAESDQKSRRAGRRHRQLAEHGKFHGGRRRFGYEPGMTEIRASEAAIVREVAERIIGGETLASIARDLNTREVATPEGARWAGPNLGTMMKRPHLAGLRVHRGQILGAADWPPVLDRTTWERVQFILTDPARRTSYTNARRYLAAGLATCAECGEVLRGRPGPKNAPESRAYACATGRHCYRQTDEVDAYLEGVIVGRLERADAAGALVDDSAAEGLADLEAAHTAMGARWAAEVARKARGEVSEAEYDMTAAVYRDELAALEARIAEAREQVAKPVEVLADLTGAGAAAAWAGLTLARKRAVIDHLCARVALRGAPTRHTPFDGDRDLIIEWRR